MSAQPGGAPVTEITTTTTAAATAPVPAVPVPAAPLQTTSADDARMSGNARALGNDIKVTAVSAGHQVVAAAKTIPAQMTDFWQKLKGKGQEMKQQHADKSEKKTSEPCATHI